MWAAESLLDGQFIARKAFAARANAFPIRLGAFNTQGYTFGVLRLVRDDLWRSFADFKLRTHLLDLRGLLFELRNHRLHFAL